jgi:Zn finger protein HypA/HybF involved in hydrogenase expression
VVNKICPQCGGKSFGIATDEWMKRTFRFVEKGVLEMCSGCGAKFLLCENCGGHYTRVHPALEAWEVPLACPSCGHVDKEIKAWDGVSSR